MATPAGLDVVNATTAAKRCRL